MDGFVSGKERSLAIERLLSSPQSMAVWHRYHVIGDVLRSAELTPAGDDQAFWERLSHKLESEPRRPQTSEECAAGATHVVVSTRMSGLELVSANASVWRWKLLAGLSSVAFVAVVGAGMWNQRAAQEGAQLAATTQSSQALPVLDVVDGRNGVMLRDPQLDQLMAAHQQLGGHSALQLPAGFLRNATYEGPRR